MTKIREECPPTENAELPPCDIDTEPPFNELQERLGQLNRKLHSIENRVSRVSAPHDRRNLAFGLALSVRMVVEVVSGPVVGAMIGWLLDSYLGTSPLFIFCLFVFGMVAGVFEVVRLIRHWTPESTPTKE